MRFRGKGVVSVGAAPPCRFTNPRGVSTSDEASLHGFAFGQCRTQPSPPPLPTAAPFIGLPHEAETKHLQNNTDVWYNYSLKWTFFTKTKVHGCSYSGTQVSTFTYTNFFPSYLLYTNNCITVRGKGASNPPRTGIETEYFCSYRKGKTRHTFVYIQRRIHGTPILPTV